MIISQAAGGVIIGPGGKVAVVNQHGNSWSLPKGRLDPGEDRRQAAKREIREETGLKNLKYIGELGTYQRHRIPLAEGAVNKNEIKEITFFLYKTDEEKLEPQDPDNPEARWVEVGKVAGLLTHDADKKFFVSIIPDIKKFTIN